MQSNKMATAFLFLIVVFIGGVVIKLAKPVLFPFFLAIFLSFVLSPVLDFMTKLKIPKALSIILIVVLSFFIIYLLGSLFFSSGKSFAAEFPKYGQKINSILISLQEKFKLEHIEPEVIDLSKQFDLNKLGGILLSSLGPFFSFISNLFLILIFLLFVLAGRGKLKEKVKMSFDAENETKINKVIENIDKQIQKYLAIKTGVSLMTGLFVTIVLLVFDVEFAIIFGFLAFLLNYIPNIGSTVATILPVAIAVLQFDTIWPAFWILLIITAIEMTIGNFVEPKLMGSGLGLSPLVVLFFLFFWGWLWGIPGMILAVPMAAVIKIICQNVPSLQFVAVLMTRV